MIISDRHGKKTNPYQGQHIQNGRRHSTIVNMTSLILLAGEFWLGLERMHSLSKQRPQVLQVDFSDWRGEAVSLSYTFQLDGEESNYALHLQPTTPGLLENALTTGAEGLPFSTADRDHDLKEDANCAMQLSGKLVPQ